MRHRLAMTSVLLAWLTCASCSNPMPPLDRTPARPSRALGPGLHARETRDPSTDTVLHSWSDLVYADGLVQKHGLDREWFPDGTARSEREFDHGRGKGRWRTWHENGALRSDYTFGASGEATPMRFFHPNGQLEAEGPAIDGVKSGSWTYWHANGQLESQGEYIAGRREGPWSFWSEEGALVARGTMHLDRRVPGEWELHR
jgi:hypothetical protein